MDRRRFLIAAGAVAAAARAGEAADSTEELSLQDIAAAFADGHLSSQQLTQSYLARIDTPGPARSQLALGDRDQSPRARDRRGARCRTQDKGAARSAARRAGPDQRQCRDLRSHDVDRRIAGADGWYAPQDAPLVERLRAAGAVILGKTNLSEWANFRSTHSLSGWSGRGGQCRNPYADESHAFGFEFRIGGRGLGEFVRRCRRHGDRWIDRESRVDQRHRRSEADRRVWSAVAASCPFRTVRTPPDP